MQKGKLGGRWTPFVPDSIEELRDKVRSAPARWIYVVLATCFSFEEDWDTPGDWTPGTTRATKREIATASGVSERSLYNVWPQLVEAGVLIENEDGSITLPKFKFRKYDTLSDREIDERLGRLEKLHSEEIEPEPGEKFAEVAEKYANPADEYANPADKSANLADQSSGDILLKGLKREKEYEEEEAKVGSVATSQEKNAVPGSDEWIRAWICRIWPARGYKAHIDDKWLAELKKFPAAELEEAFNAALGPPDGPVKYGNFEWFMNRLRDPDRFVKKRRKRRQTSETPPDDPDIGTLKADWLDGDDEGE